MEYCSDCRKNVIRDKLNIKCEDCKHWVCDDCIDGDMLNGVKCRKCGIKHYEKYLRHLHQEIDYISYQLRELKNIDN